MLFNATLDVNGGEAYIDLGGYGLPTLEGGDSYTLKNVEMPYSVDKHGTKTYTILKTAKLSFDLAAGSGGSTSACASTSQMNVKTY